MQRLICICLVFMFSNSFRIMEKQHSTDSYHIHVQFLLMPYIEMAHLLFIIHTLLLGD